MGWGSKPASAQTQRGGGRHASATLKRVLGFAAIVVTAERTQCVSRRHWCKLYKLTPRTRSVHATSMRVRIAPILRPSRPFRTLRVQQVAECKTWWHFDRVSSTPGAGCLGDLRPCQDGSTKLLC
jgi:hypothetical protein